jgi:hypothetical protein
MRLDEIARTTRVPKTTFSFPKEKLGVGAQGRAHAHPKQQHVVVKTADVYEPDTDPYVNFVKIAMEHQDNPFFPKIYKAKLVRVGDHMYQLVLTMERLQESANPKIADAVVENFKRLGFPQDIADTTTEEKDTITIVKIRAWLRSHSNRRQLAKDTPNPQFSEALTLLEPLLKRFENDMHAHNWMVRLTSSGPQLVIIDPID